MCQVSFSSDDPHKVGYKSWTRAVRMLVAFITPHWLRQKKQVSAFCSLYSQIYHKTMSHVFLLAFPCINKATYTKIHFTHRCLLKALWGEWVTRSMFSKQSDPWEAKPCVTSPQTIHTTQTWTSSHRKDQSTLPGGNTASLLNAIIRNTET